jgi:hypothetical protein
MKFLKHSSLQVQISNNSSPNDAATVQPQKQIGMDIHEVDQPSNTTEPVIESQEWRQSLTIGTFVDVQDSGSSKSAAALPTSAKLRIRKPTLMHRGSTYC